LHFFILPFEKSKSPEDNGRSRRRFAPAARDMQIHRFAADEYRVFKKRRITVRV